jgi:hypothetical protein
MPRTRGALWAIVTSVSLVVTLPLVRQDDLSIAGRSATEAPAQSCGTCDDFNSDQGMFAVVIDCQNQVGQYIRDRDWRWNTTWVKTVMPHCLTTLTSSLGTFRPTSFLRSDLPVVTFDEQFGLIIGRRTGAYVSGAYAYNAMMWGEARGGEENNRNFCVNETDHARGRIEYIDRLCPGDSSRSWVDLHRDMWATPLLCRFSSLEAMADQHRLYAELEKDRNGACFRTLREEMPHNQVQLRYEPDDIIGVIARGAPQVPHAARFRQWVSELTGKKLDLVLLSATEGCRCIDDGEAGTQAALSAMPAVAYETLPVQAHTLGAEGSCAAEAQDRACPVDCAVPSMNVLHPSSGLKHVVFLPTPHTGGNFVRCATTDWESMGIWTNQDHEVVTASGPCITPSCKAVPQLLVLIVRNPYSYWWSKFAARASTCPDQLNNCTGTQPALSMTSPAGIASFHTFLKQTGQMGTSQSAYIARTCGIPCMYDLLLHAESLQLDWLALIAQLSLPLRLLPIPDEGLPDHSQLLDFDQLYPPALDRLVRKAEAYMFEHFKYSMGRFSRASSTT